ncbi:MAG: hypothetical protein QUV07_06250 [Cyanobium sp. CZS 25K]|nr:hypothetical protein [Cyanobium sp. CZS25K]
MTDTLFNPEQPLALRELPLEAPPSVRDQIAAVGCGEDLCFRSDGCCLALADYKGCGVVFFKFNRVDSEAGPRIVLSQAVRLTSPELIDPHGLTFLDDHHLAVGNRSGDLVIYRLGEDHNGLPDSLAPLKIIPCGEGLLLHGPGSLDARALSPDCYELLVCSNWSDSVGRFLLDITDGIRVLAEDLLLRRWIDLPDGIHIAPQGRWVATSSHCTQSVLLHDADEGISPHTDPQGVLRGLAYPHGIHFSHDGKFILVADAGAPYVHIYHRSDGDWRGIHDPILSALTMEESLFRRGQINPQEGGPKGLAIDPSGRVLVTCCKLQPLAFFDLGGFMASFDCPPGLHEIAFPGRDQPEVGSLSVRLELERQQRLAASAHQLAENQEHLHRSNRSCEHLARQLEAILRSRSWGLTAPLRWTSRRLGRLRW